MYVNAAENAVEATSAIVTQDATKNGVTVTFRFNYSDGNSAELVSVFCRNSNYDMPNPPDTYFAGDTCYASVTVVHKTTNAEVTLRAKCDIYGDTGTY